VLAILLVLTMSVVWTLRGPIFFENFDVLVPGRVFRSAQPTQKLAVWLEDHAIKSILNLRGGSPADGFHREELRVAKAKSVRFFELPLSAVERPKRRDLLRMMDIFDQCEYPLLIHCKKGADRTGLACAVYRLSQLGEPPERALDSFSLSHAHIPFFGTERLHGPIEEYARWLSSAGLSHTPSRFRAWVQNSYEDSGNRTASLASEGHAPVQR
jgi:protein tyrosine/serine phosphatase